MKIFLTGGSALGKTTAVHKVCEKDFQLRPFTNLIRSTSSNISSFSKFPFKTRQMILIGKGIERYGGADHFISDRSVLDFASWMFINKYPDHEIKYEMIELFCQDMFKTETIFFIVPTPKVEYYLKNQDFFTKDSLRLNSYLEVLAEIKSDITDEQLVIEIHHLTYRLEEIITDCLQGLASRFENISYRILNSSNDVSLYHNTWQNDLMQSIGKSL